MIAGREIKIVMSLDDKDVTIKTVKVGEAFNEMQRHIERTAQATTRLEQRFTGFGQKLRDITLMVSMLRFAFRDVQDIFLALPNAIIKSSAEIERMQTLMQGLSKEIEKSKREAEALANVNFVFNLAQKAPFDVKNLGDAFVKLKVGGIDPTNGSLQALADSVARFGGGGESLKRAAIAIQQMSGKGVVSMEELRQQLGEAVPDAMEKMAIGAGMSMQELAKHVAKGEVAAGTAIKNMLTVMRITNAGASAEMMTTWNGMVEQLSTKWELFKKSVGDDGFFKEAKGQLAVLIKAFDSDESKKLAQDLGKGLLSVVQGLTAAGKAASEYADALKLVFGAYLLMQGLGKISAAKDGMARRWEEATRTAKLQNTDNLMEGKVRVFGRDFQFSESRREQARALAEQIKYNEVAIAGHEKAAQAMLDADKKAASQSVAENRRTAAQNLALRKQELDAANALVQKAEADRIRMIQQARSASNANIDQLKKSAQDDAAEWRQRFQKAQDGEKQISAMRLQQKAQLEAKLTQLEADNAARRQQRAQEMTGANKKLRQRNELADSIATGLERDAEQRLRRQINALTEQTRLEREGVQLTRGIADAYQRKAAALSATTTAEQAANVAAQHANEIADRHVAAARRQQAAAQANVDTAREQAKAQAAANAATLAHAGTANQAAMAEFARANVLGQTNQKLQQQAQELSKVTFAVRAMSSVMAGAQAIFSAFGGWVGVAAVAITWLGSKLWEFINRFKKAEEIRKRIMSGATPSDEDMGKTEKVIAEKEARLRKLRQQYNEGLAPDEYGRQLSTDELRAKMAEIDGLTVEIQNLRLAATKGRNAQIAAEARDTTNHITEAAEAEVAAIKAAMNRRLAAIDEANKKANSDKPGARKQNDKDAANERLEAIRQAARDEAAVWAAREKTAREAFEKSLDVEKKGGRVRDQLTPEQIRARAVYNEMAKRAQEAKKQLESTEDPKFGTYDQFTGDKENGRQNTLHKLNPLEQAANKARADFEKQRLQLDALREDAKALEDYKREAMTDVIEAIMNGSYDYTVRGKDKQSDQQHYVGGEQARKKLMADYVAFLQSGKGTVDDFAKSVTNLTEQERAWIATIVQKNAESKVSEASGKALTNANAAAAAAQTDLANAMDDYEAATKRMSGVDKLEMQFARLAARLQLTAEQMALLKKEQANALRDTTLAGMFRYGSGAPEAEAKLRAAQSRLNDDRQSQLRAQRDARLLVAQQEYDGLMRNAEQYAKGSEKYEEAVTAAKRRFAAERGIIETEYQEQSRTQLQALAREWSDHVEQMNQATGQWANSTVDYITGALSGVKGKFRDFVASILRDLLKMQIKDTMGKQILGFFDGVGKKALGFLGSGNQQGASAGAQVGTQVGTAVAADAATKAITSMATATNAYTGNSLGGMIAQAAAWLGIDTAKMTAEQFATATLMDVGVSALDASIALGLDFVLSAADATIALDLLAIAADNAAASQAASATTSMFANGGIMSSAGSLPLKMYANGGVATQPQMAIFGEGSMNEAFVPLPDGRSIPVTMRGDISGQGGVNQSVVIQITVNESDGSAKESSSGDGAGQWKQMANKIKGVVREELATQQRQGGMLWK